MKKSNLQTGVLIIMCVFSFTLLTNFTSVKQQYKCNLQAEAKAGKAYWFISFTKDDKTMFFSYVFNNNCNHCANEIEEAFKKYLIMNNYTTNASTASMSTYHDVDKDNLIKRRDEQIYKRKQQSINCINVSFSYAEN